MANSSEHFNQAEENFRLLRHLATSRKMYLLHDWQVTVCFYVAVHLTNVFLADEGKHNASHIATLNDIPNLRSSVPNKQDRDNLYDYYLDLKDLSQKARYLNPSKQDMPRLYIKAYYINWLDLFNTLTTLNDLINLFIKLQPDNTPKKTKFSEFNTPILFKVYSAGMVKPEDQIIGTRFILSFISDLTSDTAKNS